MNKLSPAGQPSKDNHQPYQYEYEHPFDNDRLPNFIIVGVMKGGTSAATFNLNLHPDVFCVTETSKFETMSFHKHNLENSKGSVFDLPNNVSPPKKLLIPPFFPVNPFMPGL